MFHSNLTLDLPSHRHVASPAGAISQDIEVDVLAMGALDALQRVAYAFGEAAITNVVFLTVDGQAIYNDPHGREDDLAQLWRAAQHRVTTGVFERMQVVMEYRTETLHAFVEATLQGYVRRGRDEMRVDITGRWPELEIRSGETALDYGTRISVLGQDVERFRAVAHAQSGLGEQIGMCLHDAFGEVVATHRPVEQITLIRPIARQIGLFRTLRFGNEVTLPTARPASTLRLEGAYDSPAFRHNHDPYFGLMSWVLVHDMVHRGSLAEPDVVVVDSRNRVLFTGDALPTRRKTAGKATMQLPSILPAPSRSAASFRHRATSGRRGRGKSRSFSKSSKMPDAARRWLPARPAQLVAVTATTADRSN